MYILDRFPNEIKHDIELSLDIFESYIYLSHLTHGRFDCGYLGIVLKKNGMIYLFIFFCFHLKIIIIKKLKKKFLVVFYNFLIIIIVILDTFIYKNNCFEQFYEVNLIYTVATSTVVTCRFA